jgi:mono/diheme cytochrome c family protein
MTAKGVVMKRSLEDRSGRQRIAAAALLAALALAGAAHAETPAQVLDGYVSKSAAPPQPARGQQLFTTKQGRDWSCASCHGAVPTQAGRHASTGKTIAALAPAFNPERFTDPAKVEKWFRRNCNDVVGRECTAGEKADIVSWLMNVRP